jgi:hypothetical protein
MGRSTLLKDCHYKGLLLSRELLIQMENVGFSLLETVNTDFLGGGVYL